MTRSIDTLQIGYTRGRCGACASAVATVAAVLTVFAALVTGVSDARASKVETFAATLEPTERKRFQSWYAAQTFHDAAVDAYWAQVRRVKSVRRARMRRGQVVTRRHYVTDFPPKYAGPKLGKSDRKSVV